MTAQNKAFVNFLAIHYHFLFTLPGGTPGVVSEANPRQSAHRQALVPGPAMGLSRAQFEKATWHILLDLGSGG